MAFVDYFLKIDGIAGGSSDEQHKGELDVVSWSWGVTQSGSMAFGSGGGEGKANFSDFSFTHRVDKASPVLLKACATGEHIKEAILIARKAGGETTQEFLKLTISDVLVSSYRNSGSSVPTRSIPTEAVLLTNADAIDTVPTDDVADAVSLSYRSAKLVEGPQQHIHVRPEAAGQLSFDPRTGDFKVTQSENGVVHVGGEQDALTDGLLITRAVQEYDITDLTNLLKMPFATGKLTLDVSEVRSTPSTDGGGGEQAGPVPHLHFDVVMYSPADLELTPGDLTRKGKRLGSLHVDPRGDPASLQLDLGDEALKAGGTFGIRLQLRGHPIDLGTQAPPDPEFVAEDVAETSSDDDGDAGKHLGQSRAADFTIALAFDTN